MNFRANASERCRTSSGERPRVSFTTLYSIGKSVTIPARDKRSPKTGHGFGFHDEILEDFVERRAHVDVAVGEGRAVVQDEEFGFGAGSLDLLVKVRSSSHF